ncbi:MAG: hypothetical protein ACI845_003251, partial [Gammaproteobacteria bacterium]
MQAGFMFGTRLAHFKFVYYRTRVKYIFSCGLEFTMLVS